MHTCGSVHEYSLLGSLQCHGATIATRLSWLSVPVTSWWHCHTQGSQIKLHMPTAEQRKSNQAAHACKSANQAARACFRASLHLHPLPTSAYCIHFLHPLTATTSCIRILHPLPASADCICLLHCCTAGPVCCRGGFEQTLCIGSVGHIDAMRGAKDASSHARPMSGTLRQCGVQRT
jgi:hypothetical protein